MSRWPTRTNVMLLLPVQLLRFLLVGLLAQQQTEALGGQCVDESLCPYSLQDYYSQLVNLPSRINERSVAPWSYV